LKIPLLGLQQKTVGFEQILDSLYSTRSDNYTRLCKRYQYQYQYQVMPDADHLGGRAFDPKVGNPCESVQQTYQVDLQRDLIPPQLLLATINGFLVWNSE